MNSSSLNKYISGVKIRMSLNSLKPSCAFSKTLAEEGMMFVKHERLAFHKNDYFIK